VADSDVDDQIGRNVAIHDRIARKYDKRHGEIFNDVEQARLAVLLARAKSAVRTGAHRIRALDFGCGSGNLTGQLLDLGAEVTAADVSREFLGLVVDSYAGRPLSTFLLNGENLEGVADASFDLVATYSVLHHIPDYLAALGELARVCRPGGVLVIDHERNEAYWRRDPIYAEFLDRALKFDWRKYLRPANYFHRLWRLWDPRHATEGDIHVWPDDHIEWPRIKETLAAAGFDIVAEEDYLLFRRLYRREAFEDFAGRCTDTKAMIFRKCAA
jgi:ubiquinone/menaquinone biosynthesis C-methylase UbiE